MTTTEGTLRIVTLDGRIIRVKPVVQDYDETGPSCCAAISIDKHELYIWGVLTAHINLKDPNDIVIQICWNNSMSDEDLLALAKRFNQIKIKQVESKPESKVNAMHDGNH